MFTVQERGWSGKLNGELMKLLLENRFDALITADKNLQHQQNFDRYPVPVIVLHAFRITYQSLKQLIPSLHEILKGDLSNGAIIIKE